jgi:serine/threonine protein kinase
VGEGWGGEAGGVLAGFTAGSRVAGYLLEEQVGAGGMAVVFRARDERLSRLVALKILGPALAADEDFRRRFIRESQAAATVDDPHIIPVHQAGEAGGVLFIAMRYVPGGDVRTLLRRAGPLSPSRAAGIISAMASALDAAHAAGLVHRDVKPANMLLDVRPGWPDHVYLSDFGLSKGALSLGLTRSGHFLGTPGYSAPEQIQGRPVDGRADQYALACTAFELLCGAAVFPRDEILAVMYAHLSEPPPRLTVRRPGVPAAADAVFAQALAKEPADRYASCREFADALRGAFGLSSYQPAHEVTPEPDYPLTEITYGNGPAAAANGVAAWPPGQSAELRGSRQAAPGDRRETAESWPVTQHRARHARAQTEETDPPERSWLVLTSWRIRRRLMAVIAIAIAAVTVAVLGMFTIYGDVNNRQVTGRVQRLAQLNVDVVKFSQALEDELNVSAAYVATRRDNGAFAAGLKKAQGVANAAAQTVRNDAAGITTGGGYQASTVQKLNAVMSSLTDLRFIRHDVTSSQLPTLMVIRAYSRNLITPANMFSAAIGSGANDAGLRGNVTALGALLQNENQVAVQRAILYAALVSPQGTLSPEDLTTLQQAHEQAIADLADFNASTGPAEQKSYSNAVSGVQVDAAVSMEVLAEQVAISAPNLPLRTQLRPESWNQDMAYTIGKTRTVADQLVITITNRTSTLKSRATRDLMLTSLVTLLLVLVLLLVLIVVARSLRKVRTSKLEAASRRLPGNGPRAQPNPEHR